MRIYLHSVWATFTFFFHFLKTHVSLYNLSPNNRCSPLIWAPPPQRPRLGFEGGHTWAHAWCCFCFRRRRYGRSWTSSKATRWKFILRASIWQGQCVSTASPVLPFFIFMLALLLADGVRFDIVQRMESALFNINECTPCRVELKFSCSRGPWDGGGKNLHHLSAIMNVRTYSAYVLLLSGLSVAKKKRISWGCAYARPHFFLSALSIW